MRRANFIILALLACLPLRSQVQQFFTSDSLALITSPLDLDSLVLWLRPDVGVLDSLGGSIANNEGVGTWQDQSGNGLHGTSSSTGNRPIYKATGGPGGSPYFQLNGNDTITLPLTTLITNSSDVTIFIVANYATYANLEGIYIYGTTGNSITGGYRVRATATASNSQLQVYTTSATNANVAVSGSRWYLLTSFYNGSNASHQLDNGTAVTAGTSGNINYSGTVHVIGRASTFLDGSICELIVLADTLSAPEIAAIKNYLNNKYDLY